jgi:hypothetical protein
VITIRLRFLSKNFYKLTQSEVHFKILWKNSNFKKMKAAQMLDQTNEDETKTKIEVFIRIRPTIDGRSCIDAVEENNKSLIIKKDFEQRRFRFSQIFNVESTQEQVFDRTSLEILESVMSGIFPYQQTPIKNYRL